LSQGYRDPIPKSGGKPKLHYVGRRGKKEASCLRGVRVHTNCPISVSNSSHYNRKVISLVSSTRGGRKLFNCWWARGKPELGGPSPQQKGAGRGETEA